MEVDIKNLADQFISLSVEEVQQLAAILNESQDKHVIVRKVMNAFEIPGQAGDGDHTPCIELYEVVLMDCGKDRVNVMKWIKNTFGMSLMVAKQVVDTLPQVLKTHIPKYYAEKIKEELTAIGAVVELREL